MVYQIRVQTYLGKPFSWPELLARIYALMRRPQKLSPIVLTWEDLQLNTFSHQVTYKGKYLDLTPKEYGLLELFLKNPQRIFSNQAILDRVWAIGILWTVVVVGLTRVRSATTGRTD